ncbi:MAG: DUF2156 domain-containing protein [Caldicoprobacterales bacterium]
MLTFKDIELDDKSLFDRYFQAKTYENSEYSFINLFIWRHSYNFKYTILHEHLCVVGCYRGLYPFVFSPLSLKKEDFEKTLPVLAEYFHSNGLPLVLKAVTEEQKEAIAEVMGGKIIFLADRNNFDYVYLSKDLIELKGNKYRQKRNHINKFVKYYTYEYERITNNNLRECLSAAYEWFSKQNTSQSIFEEKQAIQEIMKHYNELDVVGGAIRINGKIQAFSIGELLNPDMAVIRIEKANTDYDGSYAIINRSFSFHEWSDVTYINREEDMGIAGLRKSKESYHPVKMIKKYTGFYDERR